MPELVPQSFFNPRLQSPEARMAWQVVPSFLAEHAQELKLIAQSENIVVHFTGSTLTGQMDERSDIDLLIVTDGTSQDLTVKYQQQVQELATSNSAIFSNVSDTSYLGQNTMRFEAFDVLSGFQDKLKKRLDGSFLDVETAVRDLTQMMTQIAAILATDSTPEEKAAAFFELKDRYLWVLFKVGVFIGSRPVFESAEAQDIKMKHKIIAAITNFPDKAAAEVFWTQFIRKLFHKYVVQYELNDPSDLFNLNRHFKAVQTMEKVLEENRVPAEKKQRVAQFLRNQRRNINLPTFRELSQIVTTD